MRKLATRLDRLEGGSPQREPIPEAFVFYAGPRDDPAAIVRALSLEGHARLLVKVLADGSDATPRLAAPVLVGGRCEMTSEHRAFVDAAGRGHARGTAWSFFWDRGQKGWALAREYFREFDCAAVTGGSP
jgi:hypothetical protein